jgi:hypothetical protein
MLFKILNSFQFKQVVILEVFKHSKVLSFENLIPGLSQDQGPNTINFLYLRANVQTRPKVCSN